MNQHTIPLLANLAASLCEEPADELVAALVGASTTARGARVVVAVVEALDRFLYPGYPATAGITHSQPAQDGEADPVGDEGVCCFCGDVCNASSQACGACMRNGPV